MEALLRWNHPNLGPAPPSELIPVAVETACRRHVTWCDLGHPPLRVAVNLSARQSYDEALRSDVGTILAETEMDPSFLELEITKSVLMRDAAKAGEVLWAIKKLKFS